MSRSKREEIRIRPSLRIGLAVFGFVFMGPSILTLVRGGIEYVDYRAIVVFAPFGIAIGLTMMIIAVRLEVLERRRKKI
jgi:hypothetical protein